MDQVLDKQKLWPPNSLEFYLQQKGWTLQELAARVVPRSSHQQINKLRKRERRLSFEWAVKLGKAMDVAPEDIGYPGYPWATRAIPVTGTLGPGLEIVPRRGYKRIGALTATTANSVAIEIQPGTAPLIDGMFLFYDDSVKHPMSQTILERQAAGVRFVAGLADGTMFCFRRIQPGARRGRFHLSASGVDPILDAEIEWVSEVLTVQTGRPLPPSQ